MNLPDPDDILIAALKERLKELNIPAFSDWQEELMLTGAVLWVKGDQWLIYP